MQTRGGMLASNCGTPFTIASGRARAAWTKHGSASVVLQVGVNLDRMREAAACASRKPAKTAAPLPRFSGRRNACSHGELICASCSITRAHGGGCHRRPANR